RNQCVYCAIHEGRFGGERNFHVEHFKPKGNSRFRSLENVYKNLYYACAICNTFKGDEWPGSVGRTFSRVGFIDPSITDYCLVFAKDNNSAEISGRNIAARYMIEQLYLNRPQLILERRLRNAERALSSETQRLEQSVQAWRAAGAPSRS